MRDEIPYDVGNEYELELEKTAKTINDDGAKRVLLQLPEGLKPKAKEIQEYLEKHTKVDILIWGASNYGACDIPIEARNVQVDLIVHYGHSQWVFDVLP